MPTRSPELLEQIRRAYERSLPARTVGLLFGLANGEIYALVRRHGWPPRSELTPCERANAARAAEAARTIELYGDAVDDVRLLRQRGFVVTREGERCRVGNTLCSLAALRAKAARERRLLEADRPVEIMAAQAKAVGKAKGNQHTARVAKKPEQPATLAEAGIDKNLAHRARTLATLGAAPVKGHTGQVSPQLLATQGNSAPALVASRASGIHP